MSAPTRRALVQSARDALRRAGVEAWREDGETLTLAALAISRLDLVCDGDIAVPSEHCERAEAFCARRAAGEPVSRILGRRGFWTLDLTVAPDVLDPRADTEALVRLALRQDAPPALLLDFGCGSGAIIAALLAEWPDAFGVAADLSPAACALARRNLADAGLLNRCAVMRGVWGEALSVGFDLIVSNPPYIETAALPGLDAEVRLHDPALALDGGADGLDAYRALAPQMARLLRPGGRAVLEIGKDQGAHVRALFAQVGLAYEAQECDLAGIERALAFRRG